MWPVGIVSKPSSRWERLVVWLRKHPGFALAALTGALAFLRLIAVSHGRLRTARVLLDNADPTALAGGLLLSAALLWLPAVFAAVTYVVLYFQRESERLAMWIGVGGMLLGVVGTIMIWDQLNLEIEDLAEGGPPFVAITASVGIGLGCVLHALLRSSGSDAERPSPADGDESASSSEPDEADPELAPSNDGSMRTDIGAEPDATTDAHVEGEASDPKPSRVPSRRDRINRFFGVTIGTLFGLAGLVFMLSLVLFLLIGLWAILSAPSQPAENVTATIDGMTETRTVHVIDDSGPELLMMARSDRVILSLESSTVDDRYVCDTMSIDRRITREVHAAMASSNGGAKLSEIVKRGEGDDVQAQLAREWVDAVVATPPPCSPVWTADELEAVRADLGHICHELTGCSQVANGRGGG